MYVLFDPGISEIVQGVGGERVELYGFEEILFCLFPFSDFVVGDGAFEEHIATAGGISLMIEEIVVMGQGLGVSSMVEEEFGEHGATGDVGWLLGGDVVEDIDGLFILAHMVHGEGLIFHGDGVP